MVNCIVVVSIWGRLPYQSPLPPVRRWVISVQVMSWVFDSSQSKLGTRLVLLAIANHASHDGDNSFPSIETIAREARLSRSQVIRCIKIAESIGELLVDRHRGRTKSNFYSFPKYRNMRRFIEQKVASSTENVSFPRVKCSTGDTLTVHNRQFESSEDGRGLICHDCKREIPNSRAAARKHVCPAA